MGPLCRVERTEPFRTGAVVIQWGSQGAVPRESPRVPGASPEIFIDSTRLLSTEHVEGDIDNRYCRSFE